MKLVEDPEDVVWRTMPPSYGGNFRGHGVSLSVFLLDGKQTPNTLHMELKSHDTLISLYRKP
jgi:hypothetical protein